MSGLLRRKWSRVMSHPSFMFLFLSPRRSLSSVVRPFRMHHFIPLARMQRHHGGLVYDRCLSCVHVADYQSDDLRRSARFKHHAGFLFRQSPCSGWPCVVEQRPNHALQRTASPLSARIIRVIHRFLYAQAALSRRSLSLIRSATSDRSTRTRTSVAASCRRFFRPFRGCGTPSPFARHRRTGLRCQPLSFAHPSAWVLCSSGSGRDADAYSCSSIARRSGHLSVRTTSPNQSLEATAGSLVV